MIFSERRSKNHHFTTKFAHTKMSQEIWMASYLMPERFATFRAALKTMNNQIRKPQHVYISVCGPHYLQGESWAHTLLSKVNHTVLAREERLSQFDQIYLICKERSVAERDTFISVCDDDDFFTIDRLEVQARYIEKYPEAISFKCESLHGGADYGNFCCKVSHYYEFFSNKKLIQEYENVAPDILCMALLSPVKISKKLYFKSTSIYSRRYNEPRVLGDKICRWFNLNLE